MNLLPENASAQLVMLNGNLCSLAELALILEQFDYVENTNEPGLWKLSTDDPKDDECLLRVSNDGDTFTLYGEASEHFAAVNYVVQKAGWSECSVMSRDDAVEAKLLARLVSVGVSSSSQAMPASTLRTSSTPAEAVARAQPVSRAAVAHTPEPAESVAAREQATGADAMGALDDAHERIESLTIQKNSLEERCETLESDNRRLVSENAVLRQKLAERPPQSVDASQVAVPDIARASEPVGVRAGDTIADALIVAIERHVSSSLDLSGINGNQLVKDLKGLGFEFRVRLVGAGT